MPFTMSVCHFVHNISLFFLNESIIEERSSSNKSLLECKIVGLKRPTYLNLLSDLMVINRIWRLLKPQVESLINQELLSSKDLKVFKSSIRTIEKESEKGNAKQLALAISRICTIFLKRS